MVVFLAESGQPFTDVGLAESPDGPADVLETKDAAGRHVRYFIDPMSHMPLLVQYEETRAPMRPATPPKVSTTAMRLSGYTRVDGLMLPRQIDIAIDGRATEAWTVEKFKVTRPSRLTPSERRRGSHRVGYKAVTMPPST